MGLRAVKQALSTANCIVSMGNLYPYSDFEPQQKAVAVDSVSMVAGVCTGLQTQHVTVCCQEFAVGAERVSARLVLLCFLRGQQYSVRPCCRRVLLCHTAAVPWACFDRVYAGLLPDARTLHVLESAAGALGFGSG